MWGWELRTWRGVGWGDGLTAHSCRRQEREDHAGRHDYCDRNSACLPTANRRPALREVGQPLLPARIALVQYVRTQPQLSGFAVRLQVVPSSVSLNGYKNPADCPRRWNYRAATNQGFIDYLISAIYLNQSIAPVAAPVPCLVDRFSSQLAAPPPCAPKHGDGRYVPARCGFHSLLFGLPWGDRLSFHRSDHAVLRGPRAPICGGGSCGGSCQWWWHPRWFWYQCSVQATARYCAVH